MGDQVLYRSMICIVRVGLLINLNKIICIILVYVGNDPIQFSHGFLGFLSAEFRSSLFRD